MKIMRKMKFPMNRQNKIYFNLQTPFWKTGVMRPVFNMYIQSTLADAETCILQNYKWTKNKGAYKMIKLQENEYINQLKYKQLSVRIRIVFSVVAQKAIDSFRKNDFYETNYLLYA